MSDMDTPAVGVQWVSALVCGRCGRGYQIPKDDPRDWPRCVCGSTDYRVKMRHARYLSRFIEVDYRAGKVVSR